MITLTINCLNIPRKMDIGRLHVNSRLYTVFHSAATVEYSIKIPQKTKNGAAFWPSNSTAGNIPQES